MFNHRLPSYTRYSINGISERLSLSKSLSLNLGVIDNSDEISEILATIYHVDLFNSESLKLKFNSLDVDLIPDKYKTGRSV